MSVTYPSSGGGGGGVGFFSLLGADLTAPPATGMVITAGNHTGATGSLIASASAALLHSPVGSGSGVPCYMDWPTNLTGTTFTVTGSYMICAKSSGGRCGLSMRESATGISMVLGNDMGGQFILTGYPGPTNNGTFSLVGGPNSDSIAFGGITYFKMSGDGAPGGTIDFYISVYPTGPWALVGSTASTATVKYDHFGVEIDNSTYDATMLVFDITIGS